MKHAALLHDSEDDVAVVIRDIEAGQEVLAVTQGGQEVAHIGAAQAIPLGHNPNVAAAVVIGIEPKWTELIVAAVAETGKPVAGFSIERHGDLKTIELAARQAMQFVQWASELPREPISLSELWLSAKCGESDTTLGLVSNPAVGRLLEHLIEAGATAIFGETSEVTGAEDLIAAQAATPRVREQFLETFQAYQDFILSTGADLLGSQPTEGNIRGGISTIEEKAMGNIQKMGRNRVASVLTAAEAPQGPGLRAPGCAPRAARPEPALTAPGAPN